jgi:hypothetical protein
MLQSLVELEASLFDTPRQTRYAGCRRDLRPAIELAAMVAIGYGKFFSTACCYEIAGGRIQSEYER